MKLSKAQRRVLTVMAKVVCAYIGRDGPTRHARFQWRAELHNRPRVRPKTLDKLLEMKLIEDLTGQCARLQPSAYAITAAGRAAVEEE